MIYILDEIDKMSDDKLAEWKKYLSSQRAEKTYRYIKNISYIFICYKQIRSLFKIF